MNIELLFLCSFQAWVGGYGGASFVEPLQSSSDSSYCVLFISRCTPILLVDLST